MRIVPAGFDFHCHVDLFRDPAATIAACNQNRIVALAVTTTPRAWPQNSRWTAQSPYVHAAVGLHPELAEERHSELSLLESYMPETPFVGEIGLDGTAQHRNSLQTQTMVFTRALECAQRLGGRVLSIHSRRAAGDVLKALEENTTPVRVLPILHWFSGSVTEARKALDLGCYFSVNHRTLQHASATSLLRALPIDRLLTETDAPFAMVGDRQPEPRDVLDTARKLADIVGVSSSSMSEALATNAARVFAFAGLNDLF